MDHYLVQMSSVLVILVTEFVKRTYTNKNIIMNVSHLYRTQNEHNIIFHQIYNILDADESRIDHVNTTNTLTFTDGVPDSLLEELPPIPMYLELI